MSSEQKPLKLQFHEIITFVWFVIDAFTHLTIELGYVCLALTSTANYSDTYLGHIWREYGRADKRWAERDVNVISIEIATVFVGVLCLFQIYGVATRQSWRHPLQMIICVAELYGGWMTFAPEWIDNNPNLNGSSFELLWIYLVFMNGLWVVVPVVLLWDSYVKISHALSSVANTEASQPPQGPSKRTFVLVAGVIALYMVLVPAVLFSAAGVPVQTRLN